MSDEIISVVREVLTPLNVEWWIETSFYI